MKPIIFFATILGISSVIVGAASDHIFSSIIHAGNAERLDVALRYHQLYAVLIFCLGLYGLQAKSNSDLKWAGYIFCLGTTLFCGSLYISLFPDLDKVTYLTPVGGIMIMTGWVLALLAVRKL